MFEEGVETALIEALLATGFDAEFYNEKNFAELDLDSERALDHFLRHGFSEDRLVQVGEPMQGIEALLRVPATPDYRASVATKLVIAQFFAAEDYAWDKFIPLCTKIREIGIATPFFVIGDSHSRLYARGFQRARRTFLPLNLACTGGSALGLGRTGTRTGYGEQILEWSKAATAALPFFPDTLLKFGQVDVEFTSIFRRIKSEERRFVMVDFEAFAEESLAGYRTFLDQLVRIVPRSKLHLCSIFPPALSDNAWSEGYVNAHIGFLEGDRSLVELEAAIRTLEIPSQKTRTAMHAFYNRGLRAIAKDLRIDYVDDFERMLNADGQIKPQFTAGHPGNDHHLLEGDIAPAVRDAIAGAVA